MEAPEKIYLQVCGDCQDNECDNCKFEDLEDNVTWCKDKIFDKDIQYTRTDYAEKEFLIKAKRFLSEIHRVCDITDENGYRIELRDLQARFENFYKETNI